MVKITVRGIPAVYENGRWECEDQMIKEHLQARSPDIVNIPGVSPEKQTAYYEQLAVRRAQEMLVDVKVDGFN